MNFETARAAGEPGRIEVQEPVYLRIPSRAEYVLLARLVVSSVGQMAGFGAEDIYDLKLAVTEAVTNVIRHAAVDELRIEYRTAPQMIDVTVIDEGGGFDVEELAGEPGEHGGFGLAVIGNLVDEVVLNSAENGTSLRMIRRSTRSTSGI